MSFRDFIAPYPEDEFWAEVWERRVLHISRSADHVQPIQRSLNLEEIIWQACRTWGEVSLARAGTDYAQAPFGKEAPSVRTIAAAFAEGYTIVINNLERKNTSVAALCRMLEQEWLTTVSANLYVTAPDSQGLDPHYDDEDVFILQLEGAKVWTLYDHVTSLPLAHDTYACPDLHGLQSENHELLPGHVLYIPRGIVHEARSQQSTSVHLTVTVSWLRWVSVLRAAIDAHANRDYRFRRGVRPEILRLMGNDDVARTISTLLGSLDEETATVALGCLLEKTLASRERLPNGSMLGPTPDLEADTFEIARDQVIVITKNHDRMSVRCIGATLEMPFTFAPALERISSRQPFRLGDLPGEASSAEKGLLLQRLLECGLLTKCS